MNATVTQVIVLILVSLASGALGAAISGFTSSRQADRTLKQQSEQFQLTISSQKETLERTIQQQEHELQAREQQELRAAKAERLRTSYVNLIQCRMAMRAMLAETHVHVPDESIDAKFQRFSVHSQREFELAMDANANLAAEADAKPIHELFWQAQFKFSEYRRNLPFRYHEGWENEGAQVNRDLQEIEEDPLALLDKMEVSLRDHLTQLQ